MNPKLKASLLAILFTLILMVFKFICYFFSHSLAVLSEAWHSFSDVATSLLVFLAIRQGLKLEKASAEKCALSPPENAERRGSGFNNILEKLKRINPELTASFAIAVLLLCISVIIAWKIFTSPKTNVARPLTVGIIFIVFSAGSYFLYRFKTTSGKHHDSLALVTDGFHSLADMVIALLTGFSLILYRLGINIDKVAGFIIALIIFAFAAETLANTVLSYVRKRKQVEIKHRSSEMLQRLMRKDSYGIMLGLISSGTRKLLERIKTSPVFTGLLCWGYRGVLLCVLLVYGSTSFYAVRWDEEAIVERLGRPLDYSSTVGPGLHVKLPWPFDRVVKVNTKKIRMLNIGNVTGTDLPLLWTVPHGNEIFFISGDNNFFNPYIVIHYRVKDLFAFHYNHVRPEGVLEQVSYRVLSKTFAMRTFYDLSIFDRSSWEHSCRETIQEELDGMKTGIELLGFLAKDVHPPLSISDSFEEVIAAYQEKQRFFNMATGYRYVHIPQARVMAYNQEAEASSYVKGKVKMAAGEAKRYMLQLSEYKKSTNIIRRRFYFNAIKDTLGSNVKFLIDPMADVEDVWLQR
jgi:membrane protease subunit HflK